MRFWAAFACGGNSLVPRASMLESKTTLTPPRDTRAVLSSARVPHTPFLRVGLLNLIQAMAPALRILELMNCCAYIQ
jgi:hypothetical protein